MALIIDPDFLNQGTEVTINTATSTIQLNVAGNLSNDGVTLQALYSFLKEEWKDDNTLIAFPFPMVAITPEQFEFVEGWEPANDTTRNLLRTAGWREISAAGVTKREYMGVISLGNIEPTNTAYYAFDSDTAKTDAAFSGPMNQGVQTFGDAANGNFDKRGEGLTLYIREQGNSFGQITTSEIGVSGLSYIAYRFPLGETVDLKITASDADISTLAPYTGMSITYGAAQRDIGGTLRDFSVIIDANSATAEQVYEFIQYQLRQDADIDADAVGTKNGLLADSLVEFVGDTLKTKLVEDGGVYIDNFDSNDTNRLVFVDDTGTERTFPFVAAGSINFNQNLIDDAAAVYRMFFTTLGGNDFGTSNAVLANDNSGTPISGNVSGQASISFDFDYDGNTQGGRTAGTDADVTIVALGLDSAQYVLAEGTITRATGITFVLTSALERNYANPV